MNSKNLSILRNKLGCLLKDKEIIDIIIFGSFIKGKSIPSDIDIALITNKELKHSIEGFHISTIKPEEIFLAPPSLVNTLFREGYSLKNNAFWAEVLRFKNRILFTYTLKEMPSSKKVQIVNILRGKNKSSGLVEEKKGEWLANQVFLIPIEEEHLFEQFFISSNIKFKKFNLLMH
jgi:predicted nucleotidyltransferase